MIFLSHVTLKFDKSTLKNNRTPHLCCYKPCASFHSHQSIQTGVTDRKRQIRVKIGHLLSVRHWNFVDDLEKTIEHLYHATSSFMHHIIAISEIKLQSGNIGIVNIGIFVVPCDLRIWWVTLKTEGNLSFAASSFIHHYIAICEFKLELWSGNGQMGFWPQCPWPLTLTFCTDITFVIGNNSEKFHDDTVMGTQWKCAKDKRIETFLQLLGRS